MNLLKTIQDYSQRFEHRLAVRSEDGEITYGELEAWSNRLAAVLSRTGTDRRPVLVYGHKDPWMIVCFLACVKSGRAYCPVDCSVPLERVRAIVRCLAPSFILAVEPLQLDGISAQNPKTLAWQSRPEDCVPVEENWVKEEDLFYLIFTSGSTGDPKGVQITRSCLEHYLDWSCSLAAEPAQQTGEVCRVFLNQAPFSFDLSVMDLYTCLACGGTLWTLSKQVQGDFSLLFSSLKKSQASVWVSTPSFADLCLSDTAFDRQLLPRLETFLFCGETLSNKTAEKLLERFPKSRVINTYGPTESTVAVTQVPVTEQMAKEPSPLPVGIPKPGTEIEIWDAQGNPLPPGEKGEIVILGDTVSTGYFGRDDLTQKAFFQRQQGEILVRGYHTGDLGYLDEQGMLFYCGRMDLQVKLHGYRIELGDIENNLMRLPEVQAAAVLPKEENGVVKSLTAFVVLEPQQEKGFAATQQLKKALKGYLPDYMIPKKFVYLEQMPMTSNGKADRKTLKGEWM
ncbi:MAG: D-alanine--poly(phosphoribitol) ligase subunit DltA [Massiliimalia sp.]|jgi:D-alanine--poly(phosphoribitol) ligase subunit 1